MFSQFFFTRFTKWFIINTLTSFNLLSKELASPKWKRFATFTNHYHHWQQLTQNGSHLGRACRPFRCTRMLPLCLARTTTCTAVFLRLNSALQNLIIYPPISRTLSGRVWKDKFKSRAKTWKYLNHKICSIFKDYALLSFYKKNLCINKSHIWQDSYVHKKNYQYAKFWKINF